MPKLTLGNALWLVAYLATMTLVVWLLWTTRTSALAQLDKPQQRDRWEEFRAKEKATAASKKSPVQRRPSKSAEPPALVLLRDYFAVIVTAGLATGTVLFGFMVFVLRGVFSSSSASQSDRTASADERERLPVA